LKGETPPREPQCMTSRRSVITVYSRILIENFRGIGRLEVDGLRPINIIVGRNNCGKSTFLEALFLLGAATEPHLTSTLAQLRGQRQVNGATDALWRPLFRNLDPRAPIKIQGHWEAELLGRELLIQASQGSPTVFDSSSQTIEGSGSSSVGRDFPVGCLKYEYTDGLGNKKESFARYAPQTGGIHSRPVMREDHVITTLLSARFFPGQLEDLHLFSALVKRKQEGDVLEALRLIEPALERIEVLSEPGGPSLYLDIGLDALVPLAVCGEGIVRLFSIIVELIASQNGVLLIDEIDNGLHYSVMPRLWQLLGQLVEKHNVQVFGTTHNDDMMRSALQAFAGKEGMLGLFRIDKRGDRHVMVGYDDEAMEAVLEVPFEVRG
jgi:AAA domain, putative AbiEii toxin, Type IV TA system/AAA ATPase domain